MLVTDFGKFSSITSVYNQVIRYYAIQDMCIVIFEGS